MTRVSRQGVGDRPLVARHLETLVMVGELRLIGDGRYAAVTEPL
jgi:hypothetical protein